MRVRTWEDARVLAAAAALVGASIHAATGVFAWFQLGGGVSFRLALNTALREVDGVSGGLVLLAALLVVAPPPAAELAPLRTATRVVATVFLGLSALQVLNSTTLTGTQVELADRLQNAFEGGLPAAVLVYAARRITIGAGPAAEPGGPTL